MILDMKVNLEDLYLFYHVVDKSGFLRAAEALKICQGKVSRRIAHLEAVFGTILLYRNMRDIRLTETGKIVFKVAQSVLHDMTQAYTEVQSHHRNPSGPINLTVAAGFANYWLVKHLAEFKALHPDIKIHLVTDEWGVGDLMMGDTDIAISTFRPQKRERLQCKLLCEYPFHIYASRDYLKQKGVPQSIQDLDHHDIVAFQEPIPIDCDYTLFNALLYLGRTIDTPRSPAFTVQIDLALFSTVASGMGLGIMPAFFADAHHNIERVYLPGEEDLLGLRTNKKFIVYPKSLEQSARHKTLIRFIEKKAQQMFSS